MAVLTDQEYRRLAQQWMPGMRKGSKRRSWEHPQDVVLLLRRMPVIPEEAITLGVAWLHDVLEDGKTAADMPLMELDLSQAGVPQQVRTCVEWLTCRDDSPEAKAAYLRRLMEAPLPAQVVKAADRIVNLTEGYYTFGSRWFIKYARLTATGVIPFVAPMAAPYGPWLLDRLTDHLATADALERYNAWK